MKVNLGSGPVGADSPWSGADWMNIDFAFGEEAVGDWSHAQYMKFDFRETPWPIADDAAECVFASHIVEHIEHQHLPRFFGEIARILKADAPARIICPDPRIFIENWRYGNAQFVKDCYGMQNWERWEYELNENKAFTDMFLGDSYSHVNCPSIDWIMLWLIRVGFADMCEMNYGNTAFPQFYGTDQPDEWPTTMDNRPGMSWYLEAVR